MNAPSVRRDAHGLSLVELLVALAISMVIVIAASAFFLSSSRSRETQDAAGALQDNARFATEIITKTIQQAGYQNYLWNTVGSTYRREVLPPSDGEPDLRGYNNTAAGSSIDNGVHDRSSNRVNNSDTLIVRYQGSGASPGDGNMIDCLGRPQAEPDALVPRAYSIFEVRRNSTTSEPELRCKYGSVSSGVLSFTSEPLVRGVETLQFLYGVDTDNDSLADQWKNAEEVDTANQWALVRSVRVGMVLRSPTSVGVVTSVSGTTTLNPLGVGFSQGTSDTFNSTDSPLRIDTKNTDGRLRKVVTFTVNLRNAL